MSNGLIPDSVHSLADYIEQKLVKYADKPAYSALGQTLSFREVDEKSKALACFLTAKVGFASPVIELPFNFLILTRIPLLFMQHLRAGLVVVNTNPLYTTREMQHQFKDSGAKAIIILADFLPKLEEIKGQTDIACVITTAAPELLSGDVQPGAGGTTSLSEAITCRRRAGAANQA